MMAVTSKFPAASSGGGESITMTVGRHVRIWQTRLPKRMSLKRPSVRSIQSAMSFSALWFNPGTLSGNCQPTDPCEPPAAVTAS